MLSILDASYKNGYRLVIDFSDGKKGEVDLKEFIFSGKIKPFLKLKDKQKFQDFHVNYTIIWDDELDIAPEFLYFLAFKQDRELQQQFLDWGYVTAI